MAQLIAALTMLMLAGGALTAGTDLMDMMVRMAQVATERLTLKQIGQSVMTFNLEKGRKLTYREFHPFLRQSLTKGSAKDPAKDIWDNFYYLENSKFAGFHFPPTGDQFLVISPGPDRAWWNVDDEYWMNFYLEPEYQARLPKKAPDVSAEQVTGQYKKYQAEVASQLNKLSALLGLAEPAAPARPSAGSAGKTQKPASRPR
jgi:hypothetical protein